MATLLTLPNAAMQNIYEYCGYVAVQCLRKTCRTLRQSIALIQPNLSIDMLQVTLNADSITCSFDSSLESFLLKFDRNKVKMIHESSDGRVVKQVDFGPILGQETNYFDAFFMDFNVFWSQQIGILKFFQVGLYNCSSEIKNAFCERLPKRIQAIKVNLREFEAQNVLQTLPIFDEEILKTWCVVGASQNPEFLEIVDFAQWRRADCVTVENFYVNRGFLENISHFKTFEGRVQRLTIENVAALRRIFQQSQRFKTCQLHYDNPENENLFTTIADPDLFNDIDPNGHQRKRLFYRRTPSKILSILFQLNHVKLEVLNSFSVPSTAIIKND
ncbi:hypothetical protein GCK72_021388 [Caenorhabditis remanei]|uniref:DUF38 domain-containing protein n=1 Tax=Caenorhabditis remanei TaxID=31234 RepID=A0A6A5GJA8_CAERE|nr:hypothetical protein GCK72_021388 [Caenorhabditis remanei]KAF1754824.1 hypothetical protein GCK72_021388 [Caenorhabditis remanei]